MNHDTKFSMKGQAKKKKKKQQQKKKIEMK